MIYQENTYLTILYEKINKYLDNFVNSDFLYKIQSQYNYQVTIIYSHSII